MSSNNVAINKLLCLGTQEITVKSSEELYGQTSFSSIFNDPVVRERGSRFCKTVRAEYIPSICSFVSLS